MLRPGVQNLETLPAPLEQNSVASTNNRGILPEMFARLVALLSGKISADAEFVGQAAKTGLSFSQSRLNFRR